MAVVSPYFDNATQNLHYAVYYKWVWSEQWRYAPYFEPINATRAAMPTISTATFRMRYGKGSWENMQEMINGNLMQSYLYCYIQIRIRRGATETPLWTGVIPAETFQLLGQSGAVKTADQIIQAQGLEILLKNRMNGAWVLPIGGGEPKWIDHLPTFNKRYEYGGNIIGNRSFLPEVFESGVMTYLFSADDEGDEPWGNHAIAEYLLAHYQYETGPDLRWITGEDAIINALEGIIGVYDFRSMTVFDALNVLINRGRGFGWYLEVTENQVDIVPFSLLDENIKLGDILMPANPLKVPIDLWTERTHINVEVIGSITNIYDRIVVQGARLKSCCSLSFDKEAETPHLSLEKGWSDAEETAFKNAAKETEGYNELGEAEKGEKNDKFRAEDRFERIFTTLRVPRNWNWIVGSDEDAEIANPKLDSTGELCTDEEDKNEQAIYWNSDKRFTNSLPFKIGVDYSEEEPVDRNPANAETEFRRLFVLVKDKDNEGKYQYAEKLKPAGATVRSLTREMGISTRFNPQYLAAKNHWDDAEPAVSSGDIEEYGIDYEESIVTALLETDVVMQIIHSFNAYENQRTLIITLPDAELWYIVPGTIIGVDENGELIEYGGSENFLRDDRERLKAALTAAIAWYGKERNKIAVTIKEIDPGIPIGTLIENVDIADVGAIGSVVTELRWDFQSRSTSIMTDYGELDIAGIFRR